MSAARLLLLRHGQTAWNASGRFQGQADVELDETGHAQAARAAVRLQHEGITQLWSSDLARARQTAAPLTAATGLSATAEPRLREISVGSWEGLSLSEVLQHDPTFLAREDAGEDVRRSPIGESLSEVAARMGGVLAEIAAAAEDGEVVGVVTHGLAARLGTAELLGLGVARSRVLGGLRNCHWISLRSVGERWRMDGWNLGVEDDSLTGLVG